MKMAMWLDYKPTRYEGKGFLHRDITGEMWCLRGMITKLVLVDARGSLSVTFCCNAY
jgi:hypothetical protein